MDVFTSAFRGRRLAGSGANFLKRSSRITSRGFTLVELLVAVAVVAIVLAAAVPWVQSLVVSNRIAVSTNTLAGMLHMARSEAITRNQDVVVCHSADGISCDRANDWSDSWLVFVDADRDRQLGDDETIVAFRQATENGIRVIYRAFGSRHYLTYRPDGRTRTNGTFTVCHPHHPHASQALIVTKSGRPRLTRTRADGGPLRCG